MPQNLLDESSVAGQLKKHLAVMEDKTALAASGAII